MKLKQILIIFSIIGLGSLSYAKEKGEGKPNFKKECRTQHKCKDKKGADKMACKKAMRICIEGAKDDFTEKKLEKWQADGIKKERKEKVLKRIEIQISNKKTRVQEIQDRIKKLENEKSKIKSLKIKEDKK